MTKRAAILDRMERHNEALEKAYEYLASGAHAHWRGFRPLFCPNETRLPHLDWVANVFVPRRKGALAQCENALETLAGKAKDRRVSRRRQFSISPRGAAWSARHPVTVEVMGSNPIGDAGGSSQ
jgi:hypothetical protein